MNLNAVEKETSKIWTIKPKGQKNEVDRVYELKVSFPGQSRCQRCPVEMHAKVGRPEQRQRTPLPRCILGKSPDSVSVVGLQYLFFSAFLCRSCAS